MRPCGFNVFLFLDFDPLDLPCRFLELEPVIKMQNIYKIIVKDKHSVKNNNTNDNISLHYAHF